MAREAAGAQARLIHYELAGHYSIKAAQSEISNLQVIDAPPVEAYAHSRVPELSRTARLTEGVSGRH